MSGKYYYCNDCNEIFSEDEAASRRAVEEDCVSPWEQIMVCPGCLGEDFEEADYCERCGAPIPPGDTYCDCCEDDLYGVFDRAVCELGGEYTKAKEDLLEYIARRF